MTLNLRAAFCAMRAVLKPMTAAKYGRIVAIGSRALDRSLISVRQARLREIAGIIFNGFVRLFTGLPFEDTQCGFKAFVRERSRIIFEQQRVERFGFDPEILFLAKRHGPKRPELPLPSSGAAAGGSETVSRED